MVVVATILATIFTLLQAWAGYLALRHPPSSSEPDDDPSEDP